MSIDLEGITPRPLDNNYFGTPILPFQVQDEDPSFPIPRSIKKGKLRSWKKTEGRADQIDCKRFKKDFIDDLERDCSPAQSSDLQGQETDQKKPEADGALSDRQAAAAKVREG